MKSLEKQIEELEKVIQSNKTAKLWIEGKNATIRVDIGTKRGQEVTFPSVYEARVWLEQQIGTHPEGVLHWTVDNICDLHEESQALRALIKAFLLHPIVIPKNIGVLVDGCGGPNILDAEANFGAVMTLWHVEPGRPMDLRLWSLAQLLRRYYDNYEFKERWKYQKLSEDDHRMWGVFFAVFQWFRPGAELPENFSRFFLEVISDLPVPVKLEGLSEKDKPSFLE